MLNPHALVTGVNLELVMYVIKKKKRHWIKYQETVCFDFDQRSNVC